MSDPFIQFLHLSPDCPSGDPCRAVNPRLLGLANRLRGDRGIDCPVDDWSERDVVQFLDNEIFERTAV